jgi:signal transduction histidine kinase
VGRRGDGSVFPAEVSIGEMELGGRRLCACFVKDITRRRDAEDQVLQLNEQLEQRVAERTKQLEEVNEELKAFTYTVSHDLRSPLRSVQRFAQVSLSEEPDVTVEMREEAARRTLAASARMERLIVDLLEYSRLTRREVRPERVSLILVVQEVLGQLERDPLYARARVTVREPLPIVLGHRAILVRVMTNLLSNAIKFVPAGVSPWVRVWTEERGEMIRVWVEDNGVGIGEKDREGIFEAFGKDEEEEGHAVVGGLGLAVVRKGVERLGGRLGVESEVGKGSRFWVEFVKG